MDHAQSCDITPLLEFGPYCSGAVSEALWIFIVVTRQLARLHIDLLVINFQ